MVGIKFNVGDNVKLKWMNDVEVPAVVVQVCHSTKKNELALYRVSINNVVGCPQYYHSELVAA